MDPIAITIGCGWTLAGFLIIALSIPLVQGRVAPNSLYGIRLPQSFQSDEAWYAINRFGAKRLIMWAIPLTLVGIVCFFLSLQSHPTLALTIGLAPLVFLFIPCFESWQFARRYRA